MKKGLLYPKASVVTGFFLVLMIILLSAKINYNQAQLPGTANIFPPTGGFAIDGNLNATSSEGDWLQGSANTGGYVINADGSPVNPLMTFHLIDKYAPTADDVFKGGKIYDNPNSMIWEMQSANSKSDINHAFLHLTVDASTGDKWVIFSSDRKSSSGESYLDFEFLQNTVIKNPNGTFTSQGPHGGRTIGDFVVTAIFGNGITTFQVRTWKESLTTPGTYSYVLFTGNLTSIAYAAENLTSTSSTYPVFGNYSYPANTYVEGAVNLSQFLNMSIPCVNTAINTLFIKSKASPSIEATLQDFIDPIQLQALTIGNINAGTDQVLCDEGDFTTFTLDGNAIPVMGYSLISTTWSVVSFTGTQAPIILNPDASDTQVKVYDGNAVLKFTSVSSDGANSCTVDDDVMLTVSAKPAASWQSPPGNITVSCLEASSLTPTILSYSNGMSGQCGLSGSVLGVISGSFNECGGTLYQTWSYTDPWGVTISYMQTITVTPAPQAQFINLPTNITISCADAGAFTASDLSYTNEDQGGCLIAGTVTGGIEGTYTECGGELTQTWNYTDDCERTITHTQTITVTPAPQAQFINLPTNITISCADAGAFTASDLSYTNEDQGGCLIAGTVTGGIEGTYTECGGELTQTWNYTDDCERTITHTQTITVTPSPQAQFINLPTNITISCAEADTFTASDLSYTNEGQGGCLIAGTVPGDIEGSYTECGGELTQTWNYTDYCERTITYTQTITVTPAPQAQFINPPVNITISCADAGTFTASDLSYTNEDQGGCLIGGTVPGTIEGSYTECGGELAQTWSYTDECERTITHTQTITVTPAPQAQFINIPTDITISCAEAGTFTATDLSYTNEDQGGCLIAGAFAGTVEGSYTECGGELAQIWSYTDECERTITHTQTITVTPAPQAQFINIPTDITISCAEAGTFTATDLSYTNEGQGGCLIAGTVPGTIEGSYTECGGELAQTWSYTDDCERTITHTQTITVTPAPQAQFINIPTDITISCADAGTFTASDLSYTNEDQGGCLIAGTVSGTIEGSYTECGGELIQTWTFTDDCERSITHSQNITVTSAPQAQFINIPTDITISCAEAGTFTATDLSYTNEGQGGCLIAGTVTGTITGTYNECGGELIQTWTFTDDCERSITHSQNITVTSAPQAQFINLPTDITISCAEAGTFTASDLSYTNEGQDGCLIAGTVTGTITGTYTECGGTLTQTWTYTDDCERTITHTQTITVTPAPQAQFINLPTDITISCAEAGTFTASDLSYTNEGQGGCLIAGTVTGTITGTYTECGGTLTQTWTYTDDCERTITHTQTITVTPAPQAQFESIENISISCEEVQNLQPIILAYNNGETTGCSISGEVTGVITGEYNGCNSVLTQTWSFTDNCGRTSIQTQTITVIDNTPPTFTVTPENLVVECDGTGNQTQLESWLNSAVAIDNCSAATVTNNFTSLSNECGLTGSATVTFTATNECGLTATATASFTIEDTQAPSLNEPNDINVTSSPQECGAQVNIPIATATDGCGTASVTNNITGTNNASGFYPVGTNTIIWTATDECGNTSTEQTIVTVLDDSNPVIICPANITVNADEGVCEAFIDVPQPEVTDNCEIRQITNTYTHTDDASGTYHVGTTTVWWTAVDWSGNIANCSMTITVNDTEDPIIECPEDITVNASESECSAFVTVPVPVTSDNCGVSGVTNSYNDIEDASGIYPVGSTTIVWTVTDMGGRTATCTTTVTVIDNIMPVIECSEDITVNTDPSLNGANLELDIPIASDNCGIASLLNDFNNTNNASGFYPIGTTIVTWTVTDTFGNTANCSFDVTVTDLELPTIVCPGDINNFTDPLTCGAYVVIAKPEVFDNVGILSVINDYNQTDDASGDYPVGSTEVIWTVTDLNGNTTNCTMTVTITDNVAPTVVCPEVEDIIATEACTADVVIPKPEVSDNCGITSVVNNINFTDDASGIYPIGTTLVTWTVTDIHDNVTTCTTTVHVSSFMIAEDDNASTQLDTPVVIDVIDNDSYCINEINQASLTSTSNPVNGTIMGDPINGSFIYTPNAGYSGTDTFSYSICNNDGICDEAIVTITIESPLFKLNASNDEYTIEVNTSLEISNLTNDSYGSFTPSLLILDHPQHGTIMKSDNNVRYVPDTDYIGTDSYKYILSDINNQAIPDTAICYINIIAAPVRDTLIIYNVITPDGDGRNDTWWIDGIEENADNEVLIFNRWGDQVQYFENYNNQDIVWNGTNRSGDLLPNATYYYIVKLRTIQKVYTGWVVIQGHE